MSIIVELGTKRVLCVYCNLVVGQLAEDGGKPLLAPWHDAPCGMRCVGSPRKFWAPVEMHTGSSTCSVCKPRKCPLCRGVRTVRMSAREAIDHGLASRPIERLQDDTLMCLVRCPRCLGMGQIQGVEA